MASRSTRRSLSATCLTSALLLGIAATTSPKALARSSGLSVIADSGSGFLGTAAGEDLYLEVVLNGNPTGKIGHFVRDGARFHASAETLRQLGFRMSAETQGLVDLTGLPGVQVDYNAAAQRLDITATADLIDQTATVLNARTSTIPQPTASPGLLLNYDLYGTRDNRNSTSVSAYTELRAFSSWGVLSNTALSRWNDSSAPGTSSDTVRLDTTFSRSFVNQAVTLGLGDLISGGLDWTRPTRLGGIQLRRNFALQPELITFPVPAFYGQANLPSTVDLYINGLKQYSSDVPAGPFELNTVPIVNGSGQAQVVVTDGLGRQSTIAFPFYTTNQLLRKGLSDYSVEAGFIREDYGVDSFSYASDPAVSATYRVGVTDRLTLAGHAETVSGLSAGGGGAVMAVGQAGVINASYAASRDHGTSGHQTGLGYNWRNERFNFSVDTLRTSGDYRDIATRYGRSPPSRSDRALLGLSLGEAGSLGVNYVALEYPGEPRSRYGSAYYSKRLGPRTSLNLSVNQNLEDHDDRSVYLSFSMSLDNRVSGSVSAQHSPNGNLAAVDVNKSINSDGGFGWRLRAQDGDNQSGGLAEVGYRGQHSDVRAGVQSFDSNTYGYADLSGAVVLMDKQFFLARRIDDAFAVISTDGVANVPVMRENRPMGITNKRGGLLVTSLNAYQRNKLSIDPMGLPADVDITRVNAEVVPSDRAGTLVRFGIQPVQAATVILHGADGDPIPVGSSVTLQGSSAPPMVVGYDGIVYLEGLGAHNVLDVKTAQGLCRAQLDYQPKAKSVPLIGPLVCQENSP
ncbi:fimbria/pilus outer membrane usher protein [Novilysobacter antarcticus]|uniref:fimbria/pilus outer membrane usher protein n=1 Tax=Novilysobacter antarcticus TaxID=2862543 RepID=UPI001C993C47|nr:fimbria/pilus outer membrane usher protein [Lysobacter antarcticus]